MNFGAAISASNNVIPALRIQEDWSKDNDNQNITLLSSASIAGVALGSIIGGNLVQRGRRLAVLRFNIASIFACCFCIINNLAVICIGRFLYGFTSGVMLCATSKMMEETIPSSLMNKGYGASTNFFVNLNIMISLLFGLGMPTSDEGLGSTNFWRVIYLFPVPINAIVIILTLFVYKEDSLEFLIKNGKQEKAMDIIHKIYPNDMYLDQEDVYNKIAAKYSKAESTEIVGTWTAISDPKYRAASWICIALASFNQMSGINVICIYVQDIFTKIEEKGAESALSPTQQGYFIGISSVLGALISVYIILVCTRRQLFIGGHLVMMVMLGIVAISIQLAWPNFCLACMCIFVIVFQSTNGAAFWIYAAEVVHDSALGLCVSTLMMTLLIQSLVSPSIIRSSFGVLGLFYFFCGFQAFTCAILFFFMKETKGLSTEQKINLYKPQRILQGSDPM